MHFPFPSPHHIGSYGDRELACIAFGLLKISKYPQIMIRVCASLCHTFLVPDSCLLVLKEKSRGPVGLWGYFSVYLLKQLSLLIIWKSTSSEIDMNIHPFFACFIAKNGTGKAKTCKCFGTLLIVREQEKTVRCVIMDKMWEFILTKASRRKYKVKKISDR